MRGKSWVLLIVLLVSFFIIISCKKNAPTGILGAGKIKLTETQTPTPDVNFTVYIHQSKTPVNNVKLVLKNDDDGTKTEAYTDVNGLAGFKVNKDGRWNLEVYSFKGFKSQYFAVEPLSNTFFAKDYGNPSLDLELVSGSETIPIQPSTLVYKVTYHTKFERAQEIILKSPEDVGIAYSNPKIVSVGGDVVTCTLNIPKSFEGYSDADKYYYLKAVCASNGIENTESNKRTLTKGWLFNVTVKLDYMQVYAFDDNYRQISYYAGIESIEPGYSSGIPFNGDVVCEITNVKNIGVDGEGTTETAGTCTPWYTYFDCYLSVMKTKTSASLYNNNFRDDNKGEVTVRFHDSAVGYLDVTRTFITEYQAPELPDSPDSYSAPVPDSPEWTWGTICSYWCCTSAPSTGVKREHHNCDMKNELPYNGFCYFGWEHPVTADAKRKKSGSINITK